MKRIIAVVIAIALVILLLNSCCRHEAKDGVPCDKDTLCIKCGDIMKKAAKHTPDRKDSNCVTPQKCTVCDSVIKKAKGHTPDAINVCTENSHCKVCKKSLGKPSGHKPGTPATENTAQTCTVCGIWVAPPTLSGLGTPRYNDNKITAATAKKGTYITETTPKGHFTKGAFNSNSNGGIVSSGNYMLESFRLSSKGSSEYAESVTAFAKKYPKLNTTCMIVPKSATLESPDEIGDLYENHKAFIDATYKQIKGAKTPDVLKLFKKHKGEYLFYRTDHHWTSLGAYYTSVAYCNENSIKPRKLESYKTVVNTNFFGTLYTTFWGANPPSGISADYTVAHMPETDYVMTYSTDENAYSGEYYSTAINQSSKNYAIMFLGGDRAFTHIVTSAASDRKLLVFKESYGNAFVPFMIDYFKEIVVIDIRHSSASTEKLIEDYGITDALIINNIHAVKGLSGFVKERLES